jgi:hypothetical protein
MSIAKIQIQFQWIQSWGYLKCIRSAMFSMENQKPDKFYRVFDSGKFISLLSEVKTICIHDFVPGINKISNKFIIVVILSINFSYGSQFRI